MLMMSHLSCISFLIALFYCLTQGYENVPTGKMEFLRRWNQIISDPQLAQKLGEPSNNYPEQSIVDIPTIKFTCGPPEFSEVTPVSVHELRPSDIKIVAAMGDSITAGNGVRAKTALGILIPNRGESWSVGGEATFDKGVITFPNILRKYINEKHHIHGTSKCRRGRAHEYSGFNLAIPGDTNRGMEKQAREIVNKMKADPDIDFENDWKVVTLFIGGNDMCSGCNRENFQPDGYQKGIAAGLDILHAELPRAFVNLQAMLDVSVVVNLTHPGQEVLCESLHKLECSCAMNASNDLRALQLEYFNKLVELVDGRYDNKSDFTVVLQPHLRDQDNFKYENGSYDMSFIAPDCFHPGVKTHQAFAYMLWNMMLTPVGEKPYKYNETETPEYKCPTKEAPYFFTACNSNKTKRPPYCIEP